jgi:sirohydrochlorin ferrochelatase
LTICAGGANDVLAVPGMLFAAGHAKNDIPSVLNDYAARHAGFRSVTAGNWRSILNC